MTPEQTILLDGLKMMAQIFWGPSGDKCAEMVGEIYLDRLQSLTSVLKADTVGALDQIVSIIKGFPDGDSLYQHLEETYVRLFISAKGSITAPLYESCYEFEGALLMGRAATEMKERFEAQGLAVADNFQEPPDHLSIELEYLYFLLDKGWRDRDNGLIAEASAFVTQKMLPWVSEFQKRLAAEKEGGFYYLTATILIGILNGIDDLRLSIDD